MINLTVIPVYGYGWSQMGASIDVPDPFEILAKSHQFTADGIIYKNIVGIVKTTAHHFNGKCIFSLLGRWTNPKHTMYKYMKNLPQLGPIN